MLHHPKSGGRPRTYCRRSCRQRAYEARTLALQHGLTESKMVVERSDYERLIDLRYKVAEALSDYEWEAPTNSAESVLVRSLKAALE